MRVPFFCIPNPAWQIRPCLCIKITIITQCILFFLLSRHRRARSQRCTARRLGSSAVQRPMVRSEVCSSVYTYSSEMAASSCLAVRSGFEKPLGGTYLPSAAGNRRLGAVSGFSPSAVPLGGLDRATLSISERRPAADKSSGLRDASSRRLEGLCKGQLSWQENPDSRRRTA